MANSVSSLVNKKIIAYVNECQQLMTPKDVYLCDGTTEEYNRLCELLVKKGAFTKLNEAKHPNCYLCRSNPADVARVEKCTYICSKKQEDAGPTNNWMDPEEMKAKLNSLMKGCMKGRTMYVIPFSMGPIGGPISRVGVEITDSPYVVVNMHIMAKVGKKVLDVIGTDGDFVPCTHSCLAPLEDGQEDCAWPCNIDNRYIVQFPEEHRIVSVGSGYGGNALLGKKCFALRIATVMCREEGNSLAEHMLILGITNPQGKKYYITAAFPSACGKTNLAMLNATIPGWKIECVGDDIAWLKIGPDGRFWAINPESGFFGVAPGTSYKSNPNAMKSCEKDTIFTNVALTEDGDVWWEGMTKEVPKGKIITWLGKEWSADSGEPKPNLAHPNSRFTARVENCPVGDPGYYALEGVPVSAIIFGGRRENTVPLVFQSRNWKHGVLLGSAVASETTAAAEAAAGQLRFDPFAMLPFCGYNMGDYFGYWLTFADKYDEAKLPKIFHVNWFRKDNGRFLWPGYGENSRVLKWIIERVEGKEGIARETPIGYLPAKGALDLSGLDVPEADMEKILTVDCKAYLEEVAKIRQYHSKFGSHLPKDLIAELDALEQRLKAAL